MNRKLGGTEGGLREGVERENRREQREKDCGDGVRGDL
jgi:hypothetical protein